ncbi:hypothetical protein [Sphingomonas mali]|uniref:hypothetical protein n=1 Tax=Sphingomonas mali TaxID=40682 RepID=UPI000835255D|nr:hypothetical protein [Sphingomonas mali]
MTDRRFWLSTAAIWAGTCLLLVVIAWSAIVAWRFPDPDDQMRLLEVRDWLAGQSWFDVTQHRINLPAGLPMHWSRLVDLPIAAVILTLRPLLGQLLAEHVALVVVPLLTLGVVMALVAALARRLFANDAPALMAVSITPVCAEVLHQLQPMRIDHHGWQMAMALLTVYAVIGAPTRRSGWLAGLAITVWVTISLEGLPMIAAILALVALKWAITPSNRPLLVATMATSCAGAGFLFLVSHSPGAWGVSMCDAVSPVYLAMLAIAALGSIGVAMLPIKTTAGRLVALACVGAVALVPLPLIAPQCATGPFGQLDPLVRHFWYLKVAEGLPLWVQDLPSVVNTIGLPVIGLAGTALAVKTSDGDQRTRWIAMLFLLSAATILAILVQRAAGVANLLAIAGAVRLLHPLLLRARSIENLPKRLAATLGVFVAAAPGAVSGVAITSAAPDARVTAIRRAMGCLAASDMKALSDLPRGNVLAPLDISPTILLLTHHEAVASGYHRGATAMHDVIATFTGTADQAHAVVVRRRVDYVAFCPGLPEVLIYENEAPKGFLAQLDAGRTPAWLTPVALHGSPAKVWRVR